MAMTHRVRFVVIKLKLMCCIIIDANCLNCTRWQCDRQRIFLSMNKKITVKAGGDFSGYVSRFRLLPPLRLRLSRQSLLFQ